MEKQKRIPKRRFREFLEAGEWEKNTLGDIGRCQSGIGFPDDEQGGRIGIPFYKVSDMNNMGNERVMTNANNYVTCEQIKNNAWHPITDVPAVIFAKVGAAVLLNRKRMVYQSFLIDNNTMAYKLGDRWNDEFCKSLFDTLNFPSLVQVGALPSYNANDVERMEVYLPVLAKEQQKIGDFCRRLDTLISLHQQKLSKLKELKQAYLTEMFPAPGEKRPRRRFKGFSGDWEEIYLTDEVSFYSGLTYVPTNIRKQGTLVLRSSNVVNGEVQTSDNVYVTDKCVNSPNVEKGDIIVVVRNGSKALIGKHAQIKQEMPHTVIGAFMTGIRSEEPAFINALLSTSCFDEEIRKNMGATINQITLGMFGQMKFMFPVEFGEKNAIGRFFATMDNKLATEENIISKLQSLKQAYLSELFV